MSINWTYGEAKIVVNKTYPYLTERKEMDRLQIIAIAKRIIKEKGRDYYIECLKGTLYQKEERFYVIDGIEYKVSI